MEPIFFKPIYQITWIKMETTKQTTEGQKTVAIDRTFNLPLETLWKAWTDAESMKKWWGPKDFSCTSCTLNFRQGGSCHMNMVDREGKETWSINVYKEIIPGKKIVMTDNFADSKGNVISPAQAGMPGDWGKELIITLEFEDKGDKSGLKLRHEGIPRSMHGDCVQGWQESLDKLEKLK
jgi:uncharacterized protein YndB with AHSA1/START domain